MTTERNTRFIDHPFVHRAGNQSLKRLRLTAGDGKVQGLQHIGAVGRVQYARLTRRAQGHRSDGQLPWSLGLRHIGGIEFTDSQRQSQLPGPVLQQCRVRDHHNFIGAFGLGQLDRQIRPDPGRFARRQRQA